MASVGQEFGKDRPIIWVLDASVGVIDVRLRVGLLGLRIEIVVILVVHLHGQPNLIHVREALGFLSGFFGLRKDWEEDCRKNRDDRDYDKQFNESESSVLVV